MSTEFDDLTPNQRLSSEKCFSVLEFYQNKTILITGVTGFIGKVLLEKLLRQCTTIKQIYVLIRKKKFQSPQQRLVSLLSSCPIFESHQDKIGLIKAINGDISVQDLALSQVDRQRLINEVEIVFHSAATINFTGVFKKFIEQNIEGTNAVMQLSQQMIHLRSVVYVSTAYGNCHLNEIEEKIYPVVDDQDFESYFDHLKKNYSNLHLELGHEALARRPNPYTLSKSITEWMIQERFQSLPVIICRPSIVIHSQNEPLPGWCDSSSGYSGAIIFVALGIARSLILDVKCKADIIPVDLVVNSLIIASAYRSSPLYKDDKKVINLTSGKNTITWGTMLDHLTNVCNEIPTIKLVRPVSFEINNLRTMKDKIKFKMTSIFSHYLFAYIFDFLCLLMIHKPFMVKLIKRLQLNTYILKPFSCNEWNFHYKNNLFIKSLLVDEERSMFNTDVDSIDWPNYLYILGLGTRRYLLKEPDSTIESAKRRHYRIKIIFQLLKLIIYLFTYLFVRSFLIEEKIFLIFNCQKYFFDLLICTFIIMYILKTENLKHDFKIKIIGQ